MQDNQRLIPVINCENEENMSVQMSSCCSRAKDFFKSLSVEPALFLILFGIGLESVFITNLWVDKICYFHFNYSKAICENIDSGKYPQEQMNVQQTTNQYNVYTAVMQHLPAVAVVLLLGTWSDKRGRKLPVIIPFTGYFLTSGSVTATVYWWTLPPEYLLMCYIPLAITGGLVGVYAAIYPYLSAVTSGRARTSRISFIGVVIISSVTMGQATAIALYREGGYVAIFGSQATLSLTAVIYSIMRLTDRPENDTLMETSSEEGGVFHVLSPSHLKQTLLVVFKEREDGKRGNILGHILVMSLLVFIAGSYKYNFLYTRKKFSWNYKTFSLYSVIDTPLSAVGTLVIIPVLSYLWNVDDCILGFMGGVSLLFNNVLKATAPAPWVMYLASAIGLCISQVTAASRGALSKLVSRNELGAVFAVLAAAEAVFPMASAAINTALYNATISFFPGMIYVLNAALSIVICILYVWMFTRIHTYEGSEDYPRDCSVEEMVVD